MSFRRDRSADYSRRPRSRSRGRRSRSGERRPRRRESPDRSYRSSRRRESPDDRYERRRRDGSERESRRRDEEKPERSETRRDQQPRQLTSPTGPSYSSHPGSCTVWLGSLPDGTCDDDVFDLVSGIVGSEVIAGMKLVVQKGFGYVRFYEEGSANRILEYAVRNALVLNGKRIRVDACQHMQQLTHPFKPNMDARPPTCHTLFMGNLAAEVTDDEVIDFFKSLVPDIEVVSVSLRKGGFKGLAFAHVRFDSPESCQKAVACASGRIHGIRVRLDWAMEKASHASSGPQELPRLHEDLRGMTNKMYLGGLNDSVEEGDIIDVMKTFGPITTLKMHRDKYGVRSFAYLGFTTVEAATAAVDGIGSVSIKGLRLRADFAKADYVPGEAVAVSLNEAIPRAGRSPSPDRPRFTPVSYQIPSGYGPMRSWQDCYDKNRKLVDRAI